MIFELLISKSFWRQNDWWIWFWLKQFLFQIFDFKYGSLILFCLDWFWHETSWYILNQEMTHLYVVLHLQNTSQLSMIPCKIRETNLQKCCNRFKKVVRELNVWWGHNYEFDYLLELVSSSTIELLICHKHVNYFLHPNILIRTFGLIVMSD